MTINFDYCSGNSKQPDFYIEEVWEDPPKPYAT